jgi:hypothetical protein
VASKKKPVLEIDNGCYVPVKDKKYKKVVVDGKAVALVRIDDDVYAISDVSTISDSCLRDRGDISEGPRCNHNTRSHQRHEKGQEYES